MGVLKNITDEYFNETTREEDMTDFKKHLKTVEWVDLGHPKFLFSKEDFLKRPDVYRQYHQLSDNDLFNANEIMEIKNSLPDNMRLMTKSTCWWLFEKNDFERVEEHSGYDSNFKYYTKYIITSPITHNSIDLFINWRWCETEYISDIKKDNLSHHSEWYIAKTYYFKPYNIGAKTDLAIGSGRRVDDRLFIYKSDFDKCRFLFKLLKNKK